MNPDRDRVRALIAGNHTPCIDNDPREHLRLIREHLDIYDDVALVDQPDRDESWDNINFAMARLCEILGVEPEEIS